jgi:hypothetical protein
MFTYKLDVLRDGKFSFSPLLGIVRVFLRGPSIDQLNCPSIVWLVNISECKLNFLRKLKFSSDPPLLGIVEIFLLGTSINQLTRAQVLYNWLIDFWIPGPNKKKICWQFKIIFFNKMIWKTFFIYYIFTGAGSWSCSRSGSWPGSRARLSVPPFVASISWNF